MNFFVIFRNIIFGLFVTVFSFHPVWADDIEIFFNTASNPSTQPNLLFVLDASASMQWFDCADGSRSKTDCGDGSLTGSFSRLDRMNMALKQVLDISSGVNVGIMRFGGTQGGRVIYPMRDLDAPVCEDADCLSDRVFSAQGAVKTGTDDATEDSAGGVVAGASILPLTNEDDSNITAVRFSDLRIPQGAIIEDAKIHFHSPTASTENDLTVQVEDVGNADSFLDGTQETISSRSWSETKVSWNSTDAWLEGGSYESDDLSLLVSHVVNKDDWCGGNALALKLEGTGDRSVTSYDEDSVNSMILKVKYKLSSTSTDNSCMVRDVYAQPTSTEFDGFERLYGGNKGQIKNTWGRTYIRKSLLTGFQFKNVEVPKGAVIREAYLRLYSVHDNDFTFDIDLSIEASADPEPFSDTAYDYTSRTKSSVFEWVLPGTQANTWIHSPDLSETIGNTTSMEDWESGNSISFFLDSDSAEKVYIELLNGRQRAPTLVIRYEATEAQVLDELNSIRSQVKSTLDDIKLVWGTPTVGAMEEGMRYYAGAPVNVAKQRALYYQTERETSHATSRVSHPDTYTGGAISRKYGCTDDNLNSVQCSGERIIGDPVYVSPIQTECQANHMIVLTDGGPYVALNKEEHNPENDIEGLKSRTAALIGKQCDTSAGNGVCGVELATFMNQEDTDVHPLMIGNQRIQTHTIGFNVKNDWIKNVGVAGGGGYHEAASANDLVEVVTGIVKGAIDTGTTFVSPAITVDQYSRLSHRADTYFALFYPGVTASWDGNLKRYDLGGSGFVDKVGNNAVDSESGKFASGAWSFWTEGEADGNNTLSGGAASLLNPANRTLVTYLGGTEVSLIADENKISEANKTALLNTVLGEDGEDSLLNYIDWLSGVDVKDEDKDDDITDFRHHIGDALHSQPVVVTYAGTDPDPDPSVVFVGTNEGFLHAFDTTTGVEKFAFMPEELFSNVPALYENLPVGETAAKPYGLDGNLAVRMIDANKNGIVESGDEVHLIAGMRRGGRNYYALDVSNPDSPSFKWQISGGSGDFSELGQTWSKPTLANIKVGNVVKKVLIFGGGYDPDQDDHSERTEDDIGRAIYIVDADDGTLIWSGGPTGVQPTKVFTDMIYSIPSDLKVISNEKGNLVSEIFVGDMGGRIWRFDINNGQTGSNLVDGGVIADLGVDENSAGARRFYHAPDLSLTRAHGGLKLNIAIGSGFQAHPLNTQIDDKFFVIHHPYRNRLRNYGLYRSDTESYSAVTLTDLFDTTDNLIAEGDEDQIADAKAALAQKEGWYITMEATGEKILGSSATIDNVVKFISYVPTLAVSSCVPNVGKSYYWTVNMIDGTPYKDPDTASADDAEPVKADRKREVPGDGLAPPVQVVFVPKENDGATITDMSGINALQEWGDVDMFRRWYWAESP